MPKETSHLSELLSALPPIEMQKEKLSQRLEEIPLETQLLSLSNNSLERETDILREVLEKLKKLNPERPKDVHGKN